MFKAAITAKIQDHKNHFSVSMPNFFSVMNRDEREDLIEHFKDHGGAWNAAAKTWDFIHDCKVPVFRVLQAFNVRVTVASDASPTPTRTNDIIVPPPSPIEAPRRVLVAVPVQLVGPDNPAVQRILESTYARLEQEFLKLHMETGVCKTKMRELLSRAVPAVINPLFTKVA